MSVDELRGRALNNDPRNPSCLAEAALWLAAEVREMRSNSPSAVLADRARIKEEFAALLAEGNQGVYGITMEDVERIVETDGTEVAP